MPKSLDQLPFTMHHIDLKNIIHLDKKQKRKHDVVVVVANLNNNTFNTFDKSSCWIHGASVERKKQRVNESVRRRHVTFTVRECGNEKQEERNRRGEC